jgi:hypothetical protein
MNNTSPIYGKNLGSTINGGNGFFYNTNSFRRTDFVNITGYSAAGNAAVLGGFEFWIHNYANPAYSIATIDYLGLLTISSIATNKIVAPYITVNSLCNLGSSIILNSLSNVLTFPLPEMIFCNCSLNAVNITLPDISSLPATSGCKITVRRILNTSNQINILCFGTFFRIFSNANVIQTLSNAIGNCCQLLLCGNYWYINFIN